MSLISPYRSYRDKTLSRIDSVGLEPGVDAAGRDELVMAPLLYYAALVQYHDAVGAPDRTKHGVG